jgi:plastocyanin
MRKYWPFIVVIVVIVAVAALALGNKDNKNATTPPPAPTSSTNSSSKESTNTNTATPAPTPNPEASSTSSVSIANMSYSPASLTLKKGTKVTWTNNDDVAHTVTADTGNAFDSGNMDKGKTFSFTFNTAGTFAYHCTYHPNMHGTVTVTE